MADQTADDLGFDPRPFWTGVLVGAGIIAATELWCRLRA